MDAVMWQGDPVEGFERVNGPEGFLLLIPTLDNLNVLEPGGWIVSPNPSYSFGCPAGMFDETYEVIGGAGTPKE